MPELVKNVTATEQKVGRSLSADFYETTGDDLVFFNSGYNVDGTTITLHGGTTLDSYIPIVLNKPLKYTRPTTDISTEMDDPVNT